MLSCGSWNNETSFGVDDNTKKRVSCLEEARLYGLFTYCLVVVFCFHLCYEFPPERVELFIG